MSIVVITKSSPLPPWLACLGGLSGLRVLIVQGTAALTINGRRSNVPAGLPLRSGTHVGGTEQEF
jgi:hypothetical protein